ncbi:MAG: hypothetical protein WBN11_00970, partial [Eudoraea sp.]|uniref:hypothetical protein n=1 Tax=Eudoraea sp. TaxID=1979955 RepID=UPI003C72658E
MLPKKTRHLMYAVLLLALFIVGSSAIAKSNVYRLISDMSSIEVGNKLNESPHIALSSTAENKTSSTSTTSA